MRLIGLFICCFIASDWLAEAQTPQPPLLAVLSDTGEMRDGLAVLRRHSEEQRIVAELSRGFPLKVTRLYRYVQSYLHSQSGQPLEPAYLLFSSNQGGFPRFGFYLLDEAKHGVAYVDLYRSKVLSGRFGAVDQIFPHEMGHVLLRLLVGRARQGRSYQLHAVAVRTDPETAFDEGFAEHMQVMAIDDPESDPATRALASDDNQRWLADRQMEAYLHEMQAVCSFASARRISFLFWYSGIEQVLRYHAVKANAFAYAPEVPWGLLSAQDPYRAYLLSNILPGKPGSAPKSAAVMLSTEGVVSSLFYRLVTDATISGRYLSDEFYGQFGAAKSGLGNLENAYLKLFHVFNQRKPADAEELLRAYQEVFPEESLAVEDIARSVLLGQSPPRSSPIWLLNTEFRTGTSLFDQYRAVPRSHAFDLNTATALDLTTVPGVDRNLASAILEGGPFSSVAHLARVPGMTSALARRFEEMQREMQKGESGGEEGMLEAMPRILFSYAWRALMVVFLASFCGGLLFRRVRGVTWRRSFLSALLASLLVAMFSWGVVGGEGVLGYILPVFGLIIVSSAFQLIQRRFAALLPCALGWLLAALPAKLLTYPWF
jgi:hypothetical protein